MPGTISLDNAVNNTFANNNAVNITAGDNALITLALITNNMALTNQTNALFPMTHDAFESWQKEHFPASSAPPQVAALARSPEQTKSPELAESPELEESRESEEAHEEAESPSLPDESPKKKKTKKAGKEKPDADHCGHCCCCDHHHS